MAHSFDQVDVAKAAFDTALEAHRGTTEAEKIAQEKFDAASARLTDASAAREASDLELEYATFALDVELQAIDIVAQPAPEPEPEPDPEPDPDPTVV